MHVFAEIGEVQTENGNRLFGRIFSRVFFNELFQVFWSYLNHLPVSRVVQYHFIIGYFCQDLAFL